jgi:hypothetical protein
MSYKPVDVETATMHAKLGGTLYYKAYEDDGGSGVCAYLPVYFDQWINLFEATGVVFYMQSDDV